MTLNGQILGFTDHNQVHWDVFYRCQTILSPTMIIDKLDFMDELWYLPQCVPRVFPLIKNDRGENSILTDTSTGYSLMKIQI